MDEFYFTELEIALSTYLEETDPKHKEFYLEELKNFIRLQEEKVLSLEKTIESLKTTLEDKGWNFEED